MNNRLSYFFGLGVSAIFLALLLQKMLIVNDILYQGGWDQGITWFLILKAIQGLKPNVDFVSGYTGGFEALFFLLSRFFTINLEFIKSVQFFVLGAYFSFSYLVLRKYLPISLALGFAGVIAFFGFGDVMLLSPGVFVQLLTILAMYVLFPSKSYSMRHVFLLGVIAGLALLFKQSGVFLVCATIGVLSLRFLALVPKLSILSKLIVLLPINVPLAGYIIFRVDFEVPYLANYVVLLPWLTIGVIINAVVLFAPSTKGRLGDWRVSRLMTCYFLPYIIGLFGVLSCLPLYYGENTFYVLRQLLFHAPSIVDRFTDPLRISLVEISFIISFLMLPMFIYFLRKSNFSSPYFVSLVMRWGDILLVVGALLLGMLFEKKIYILLGIVVCIKFSILWGRQNLVSCRSPFVSKTSILPIVLFTAIMAAIAWPRFSSEFIGGVFALSLILVFYSWFRDTLLLKKSEIRQVLSVFLLVFSIGIYIESNIWLAIKKNSTVYKGDGFVEKMITPYFRGEGQFFQVAEAIKSRMPAGTSLAGYPNMAFPIIAGGFVPVTAQGNYIGDFGNDFDLFMKDIVKKEVDCFILNTTFWPYEEEYHIFFPPIDRLEKFLLEKYNPIFSVEGFQFFCHSEFKEIM